MAFALLPDDATQKLATPQKVAIVQLYTQYSNNAAETACQFFTLYPGFTVTRKHLIKVNRKFDKTGSVLDLPQSGRPRTGQSDENIAAVQAIVDETPKTSRNMPCQSGKKGNNYKHFEERFKFEILYPYLHEDDYDQQLKFAQTFLTMVENNPDILKLTLWSDEANFKVNGHVNWYNAIYWSTNNPHQLMPVAQQGPGVMVWCGILHDEIIGPFFIEEGIITGVWYQKLLQHKILPVIQNHPDLHNLYFQQDGTQPHFSHVARDFLDEIFPQQ